LKSKSSGKSARRPKRRLKLSTMNARSSVKLKSKSPGKSAKKPERRHNMSTRNARSRNKLILRSPSRSAKKPERRHNTSTSNASLKKKLNVKFVRLNLLKRSRSREKLENKRWLAVPRSSRLNKLSSLCSCAS